MRTETEEEKLELTFVSQHPTQQKKEESLAPDFSLPPKFFFFFNEICMTQNSIFIIAAEGSCAYHRVHDLPQSIILLLYQSHTFFNYFPPISGEDMRNESNISL